MPKLTNRVPSYRRHRQSGQGIVTLNGRDFLLGRYGTKASRAKYNRLVAEWLAGDRRPLVSTAADLSVTDLAARYWCFATSYYVKNGRPTDELGCIRSALRPLLRLYENESAAKIGPLALVAVRDAMLACGWSRKTVNKQIDRVRRMYRWGVEKQLVPETTYSALKCVAGLRKGRCIAPEAEPVKPVDDDTVDATLPLLPQVVADMVRVHRLTGMRPAELCIMRPMDIDQSGDVWVYRPESHKCEHHNQQRQILIGPRAQDIILSYLARDPAMYCFRPVDSEAKRRAAQHANRKTPLLRGNRPGSNRKRRPKCQPTDRYSPDTYRRAIERACDRRAMLAAPQSIARADDESVNRWQKRLTDKQKESLASHCKKFRWTPNQLRHAAATEIRRQYGLEAAQILLGHAKVDTTQLYAERDLNKGLEIAKKIG